MLGETHSTTTHKLIPDKKRGGQGRGRRGPEGGGRPPPTPEGGAAPSPLPLTSPLTTFLSIFWRAAPDKFFEITAKNIQKIRIENLGGLKTWLTEIARKLNRGAGVGRKSRNLVDAAPPPAASWVEGRHCVWDSMAAPGRSQWPGSERRRCTTPGRGVE